MADPKIIQFPLGLTENLHYHYTKVEVSSAGILILNSAPTTLVVAPGAGKILLPIHVVASYTFDTVAYDTNTALSIIHDGKAVELIGLAGIINQGANIIKQVSGGITPFEITANLALQLTELTGDPATGGGTLTIYLWYIRLEL